MTAHPTTAQVDKPVLDTVAHAAQTPDVDQPWVELGLKADEYATIREIVGLESQLGPRLLDLRGLLGVGDGVEDGLVDLRGRGVRGHEVASAFRTEVKNGSPSVEGP